MEGKEQSKWLIKANELIKQFYSISNDYQVAIDSAIFMVSFILDNSHNHGGAMFEDEELECCDNYWEMVLQELESQKWYDNKENNSIAYPYDKDKLKIE